MAKDIFEEQEITVKVKLMRGTPNNTAVKFIFKGDDQVLKEVPGTLNTSEGAKSAVLATCTYKTAKVAADKPSYLLTYSVDAAGKKYNNDHELRVWPKKLKLKAVEKDDPAKPLKGFKFKVVQGDEEATPKTQKVDGDQAAAEVDLECGSGFTVEAVAPFEMTDAPTGPLRDLTCKAEAKFIAEFVKPTGDLVKQYVNLTTGKSGQDGKGNKIVVQVGVKGDRDPATKTKLGAPGLFVFIEVDFDPTRDPVVKKSERNNPKTALLAGKNLSGKQVVTADKKFKGKVELAAAGGIGEFELELGKAGGDRCEIKIGGTSACSDAKLTIENWRKIYYELMAPDFMALDNGTLDDGTTAKGMSAAAKANLKKEGDKQYIEYVHYKTHLFTKDEAVAAGVKGAVFKREFFGLTTGPAEVYLLTDYTFTKYPKTFDKGMADIGTLIKMCNKNLFCDGPRVAPDKDLDVAFTSASGTLNIYDSLKVYWSPVSAYKAGAGADAVRSLSWTAVVDPVPLRTKPTVTLDPDGTLAESEDAAERTVRVQETVLNLQHDVKFDKPMIGNISTTVSSSEQTALDNWLKSIATRANMKQTGKKLKFKVSALVGSDRKTTRRDAVKNLLPTRVAAVCSAFAFHPGLDDSENPREGDLPLTAIDVDASTHAKMFVNLPATAADDPGSFVGADQSATKCKITVSVTFEPQKSGLGLAGAGAQKGELLFCYSKENPLVCSDVMLHELGHQYKMTTYNMAADSASPGMRKPKAINETEDKAEYQSNGTKGHYYNAHNHSGNHCALGLSDAQKGEASFSSKPGKCTMFGENSSLDSRRKPTGFCQQCVDYIRARDLSALA
jgi:hypothetical protein